MNHPVINLLIALNAIRLVPHVLLLLLSPRRSIICLDIQRWAGILFKTSPRTAGELLYTFLRLMTLFPEYRSLFLYRLKTVGKVIAFLYPPMPTLFIHTKDIGPGLFIQHGFSTIIAAKTIGKNCWVNQQVTIGFSDATQCPVIGGDVVITAGAKIIGDVTVGSRTIVGANAVVVKDVPDNCTVVGVPAYIVRQNGERTNKPL